MTTTISVVAIIVVVGIIWLAAELLTAHEKWIKESDGQGRKNNGDVVFVSAMLEWYQITPKQWRAVDPTLGVDYKPLYYNISQFGETQFELTYADDHLLSHREPFDTFFAAAMWAESDVLREIVEDEESNLVAAEPCPRPDYVGRYLNGCTFATATNTLWRPPRGNAGIKSVEEIREMEMAK